MEVELPTKDEYNWYLAILIHGQNGGVVGMETYKKYKEIEKKIKNIKFPATEQEIYNQLK